MIVQAPMVTQRQNFQFHFRLACTPPMRADIFVDMRPALPQVREDSSLWPGFVMANLLKEGMPQTPGASHDAPRKKSGAPVPHNPPLNTPGLRF
jgi:hypothetical protein